MMARLVVVKSRLFLQGMITILALDTENLKHPQRVSERRKTEIVKLGLTRKFCVFHSIMYGRHSKDIIFLKQDQV